MLLEIGVGDAYGCGFEYSKPTKARPNDLSQFRSHPKWRQRPGKYTDDTEMSIAIAELLVEGVKWSPVNIAQKFVDVFHRNGQRTGYAAHFYNFLCSVTSGAEFLLRIMPDSEKSGAAMRSCPLGIIADEQELLRKCEIQARVTHNTDAAVTAAQAAALMTHCFIYNKVPKYGLTDYLQAVVPGDRFGHDWGAPWGKKVGPPGCESVHAAIEAVVTSYSMSEILKKCIDYTGDVDTVAAIALGAASCSNEIEQDLPQGLILNLENGTYGRDFLIELDRKLMSLRLP
jgi:ADP-ribosyl-[dinitrogen reductase] hydrolase